MPTPNLLYQNKGSPEILMAQKILRRIFKKHSLETISHKKKFHFSIVVFKETKRDSNPITQQYLKSPFPLLFLSEMS